jgi:hypothetical protein
MRDIRDYLVQVRPQDASTGLASPFNVKKESLTLANFTQAEIQSLYNQHTEATGQQFTDEAIDRAWYWTSGQPWLVNALAYEAVVKLLRNDYSKIVTGLNIDQSAATLIQRRDTHIDSLLERLKEPRVIRVMDAVFSGATSTVPVNSDDRQYCLDLGLVCKDPNQLLQPANKIYEEVMSRVITEQIQHILPQNIVTNSWTDGNILLVSDLLKEFQSFWRRNSASFPLRYKSFAAYKYDEATHLFMLLAFLQRVINSGGSLSRQSAEGRGRVDLEITFKSHIYLIEVKLNEYYFNLSDSFVQLSEYMSSADVKEGWLVVFDRDQAKSWDEKIYWQTENFNDKTIHVVGC